MFSNSKNHSSPHSIDECNDSNQKFDNCGDVRAADNLCEEHIACCDHQCFTHQENPTAKDKSVPKSYDLHTPERLSSTYREDNTTPSLLKEHGECSEKSILKGERGKVKECVCHQREIPYDKESLCDGRHLQGQEYYETQDTGKSSHPTKYASYQEPIEECGQIFVNHRSDLDSFSVQLQDEESSPECTNRDSYVENKQCEPSTQISDSEMYGHEETFELLALPTEVISLILQHLPSNALLACMSAHPLLKALINHPCFLDEHINRVLGLGFVNVNDIKAGHASIQVSPSPLMELWFKIYNVISSREEPNYILLNQDNIFFPIECFRHSLLTWLVQASNYGSSISNMQTELPSQNSEEHLAALVDNFFFKKVLRYPNYVLRPLTKLALLFPEFLEWTILASHLDLHYDKPKSLKNVWYEDVMEKLKQLFEPKYCLEVICGETTESFAHQSAMIIFFSERQWAVWTGRVTHFPGCNFVETWTFDCLDQDCGLSSTKGICGASVRALQYHTVADQPTNSQWKRRNMFPGLCYLVHQHPRDSLLEKIHKKTNDLILCLGNLTEKCRGLKCSRKFADSNRLRAFLSQIQVLHEQMAFYKHTNRDQNAPLVQSSLNNTHGIKSNFFLSNQRTYSDIPNNNHQPFDASRHHQIEDDFLGAQDAEKHHFKRKHVAVNSKIHAVTGCEDYIDIQHCIALLLDSLFRDEVLIYVSNMDSHQVLCPQCNKFWFPNIESTEACVQEIKSQPFVPYSIWPYDLLNDVLCILVESCSRISSAC